MRTDSFKYDPCGRRIYKSSSSGTSIYAYDAYNLIEEVNAADSVMARYAQNQKIDEQLAMLRGSTISYYEADGLGSVTSLSNSAGALAQTYTFDSFGKQTASTGTLSNRSATPHANSTLNSGPVFERRGMGRTAF